MWVPFGKSTMPNSSHSNVQTALRPVSIPKIVAGVFSLGVIFGTGLGHGYHRVIAKDCPLIVEEGRYNLLYLGMSPTDARSVLGPGTETSRSALRVEIKWPISEAEIIIAVFENGKLVEKTQKDL